MYLDTPPPTTLFRPPLLPDAHQSAMSRVNERLLWSSPPPWPGQGHGSPHLGQARQPPATGRAPPSYLLLDGRSPMVSPSRGAPCTLQIGSPPSRPTYQSLPTCGARTPRRLERYRRVQELRSVLKRAISSPIPVTGSFSIKQHHRLHNSTTPFSFFFFFKKRINWVGQN
ncbi:hypothetical protein LX36DRAFT_484162 [Colletotrichum falcatum]|nr:hypothetical protein LX36DRAFT_484162 [Colletotrichum falcatum]